MTNRFISTFLSLLITVAALSQNTPQKADTPEIQAQQMTEDMMTSLKLSPEQKEAIYEANLRKTKAVTDNTKVAKDVETRYDDDLRRILTKDQYAAYLDLKKQKEKEAAAKSREPAPAKREKMKTPAVKPAESEKKNGSL